MQFCLIPYKYPYFPLCLYKVNYLIKIAIFVKFINYKNLLPQEPFATIENFVKLAKKEIVEVGFVEFKSAIISSKDKGIESIKKEPVGSDFNCSSCLNGGTSHTD